MNLGVSCQNAYLECLHRVTKLQDISIVSKVNSAGSFPKLSSFSTQPQVATSFLANDMKNVTEDFVLQFKRQACISAMNQA